MKFLYNIKEKFHSWKRTRFISYSSVLACLFLSSFSTMALSGRYPLNYVNMAIYFITAISIIVYVSLYGKFIFDSFFLLIFLIDIFILISSMLTGFRFFSYTIFLVTIFSLLIYQFVSNSDLNDRESVYSMIMFAGYLFVIYFTIVYWDNIFAFNFSTRIGDYFDNENEVSKYFVFLIVFSLHKAIYNKKYIFLFPVILYLFILLLMTGSRSNLLSAIAVCLFVAYFRIPKGKKIIYLVVVVSFIATFFLILQIPAMHDFSTRFYNMFKTLLGSPEGLGEFDFSIYNRIVAVEEGIKLFLARPLFGYGFRGTRIYSFISMEPHNNFIFLLGNFGAIVFILFEFFLLLPIYRLLSKYKVQKNPFLLLVVSIILYVFVFQFLLVNYYTKFEYFAFPFAYLLSDIKSDYVELDIVGKTITFFKGRKYENT